jgi:hypothetical protein
MLALILTNLIWILYSISEGFKDGFYWFFKVNSKRDCSFEIHPVFAAQRGIVLTIIGSLLCGYIGITYSLYSVICMALIFSFFHNGTYYTTRNKLDDKTYPLKWSDQSTTSTAKLTNIMTYRNRTIFMILGVLSQVFIYIFLIHKK